MRMRAPQIPASWSAGQVTSCCPLPVVRAAMRAVAWRSLSAWAKTSMPASMAQALSREGVDAGADVEQGASDGVAAVAGAAGPVDGGGVLAPVGPGFVPGGEDADDAAALAEVEGGRRVGRGWLRFRCRRWMRRAEARRRQGREPRGCRDLGAHAVAAAGAGHAEVLGADGAVAAVGFGFVVAPSAGLGFGHRFVAGGAGEHAAVVAGAGASWPQMTAGARCSLR